MGLKLLNHNRAMISRLLSLLIWAAVAASAVYWGLRLFTHATPVPAGVAVANAPAPAAGNLARLLGMPPVQPVAVAEAAPVDSRFRLVGVVAPRIGQASGLALISVDGKPARAVGVGREIEPGLRLLAVRQRQAELGVTGSAPALTLVLPALAEASRGRPGETGAPPGAVPGAGLGAMPGAMSGAIPGAIPGGAMPSFNNRGGAGGLPPGLAPRMAGGSAAPLPGMPIQPAEPGADGQPDSNGNATR